MATSVTSSPIPVSPGIQADDNVSVDLWYTPTSFITIGFKNLELAQNSLKGLFTNGHMVIEPVNNVSSVFALSSLVASVINIINPGPNAPIPYMVLSALDVIKSGDVKLPPRNE